MHKLWLALLFFAGGVSNEIRHPLQCDTVASGRAAQPARRERR